jgi:plastocyanin
MKRCALLILLALLPACKEITAPPTEDSPGGAANGPAGTPTRVVVEIVGFEFRGPGGSTVAATVGDTIEFVNRDAAPHTATSASTPAGAAAFDSGRLAQGQSFRIVVTHPGTWSFLCDFHPTMRGSIAAAAPAGGAPPAAPPGGTPPTGTPPATPPGAPATPPPSGTVTVVIRDDRFVGPDGTSTIAVSLGQTVEFVNQDDRPHTATSTGAPPPGGAAFDSGRLGTGAGFRFTPGVAGAWSFLCDFHPEMRGTLVVGGGGGGQNPGPGGPGAPPPGGTPPGGTPPPPTGDVVAIVITDAGFAGNVTVDLGQTLEWRNQSSRLHDLRSDDEPDEVERFESGVLSPGERFRFTPSRTGVWTYRCKIHEGERGFRITVR